MPLRDRLICLNKKIAASGIFSRVAVLNTLIIAMLVALPLPAFALLVPQPEHMSTQQFIVHTLSNRHYNKYDINDDLSSQLLDSYLRNTDSAKLYFLASDIQHFEAYRYRFDDFLKAGNLKAGFEMYNTLLKRQKERFTYMLTTIEKGIDQFSFDRDEYIELDREYVEWFADIHEADIFWRKRLKASVLAMLLDKKEPAETQEILIKQYKMRLKRIEKAKDEDAFQTYMNALTKLYDPHTQYFSPRSSEDFNISMSLSLEGIGALLQIKDEVTTVVRLIPAGPAEKAGELKPNDQILAVGQGKEGEMINIVGWLLNDVVNKIRGPKDTVVRLEIKSTNEPEARVIEILRNTITLEEQSAKSSVIEVDHEGTSHKIGVIKIPIFYLDFKRLREGAADYRSTTRDVKKLIEGLLHEEDISALIIDLRNNGGGSLQEATALIGLFVPSGPTVQVRDANNQVNVHSNNKRTPLYDGPLAVLVNRLSASASEIFSGAIQDYKRGPVIGSRTYGKGTVQQVVPLQKTQVKITQAKFYRISGASTQHLGVIPDIKLPSLYNPEHIGESALKHALSWDEIRAARYREYRNLQDFLPDLKQKHEQRAKNNPEFIQMINSFAETQKRKDDTLLSLNREERKLQQEHWDEWQLGQENNKRGKRCLTALASLEELDDLPDQEELVANCKTDPGFSAITLISAPKPAQHKKPEVPVAEQAGSVLPAMATAPALDNPDAVAKPRITKQLQTAENKVSGADMETVNAEGASEKVATNLSQTDPLLAESGRIMVDLINLQKKETLAISPWNKQTEANNPEP